MRLFLLFIFVFIVILQIACNSNECGKQFEIIGCGTIKGGVTFIHVAKFMKNLIYIYIYTYFSLDLVLGNPAWANDVSTSYD